MLSHFYDFWLTFNQLPFLLSRMGQLTGSWATDHSNPSLPLPFTSSAFIHFFPLPVNIHDFLFNHKTSFHQTIFNVINMEVVTSTTAKWEENERIIMTPAWNTYKRQQSCMTTYLIHSSVWCLIRWVRGVDVRNRLPRISISPAAIMHCISAEAATVAYIHSYSQK